MKTKKPFEQTKVGEFFNDFVHNLNLGQESTTPPIVLDNKLTDWNPDPLPQIPVVVQPQPTPQKSQVGLYLLGAVALFTIGYGVYRSNKSKKENKPVKASNNKEIKQKPLNGVGGDETPKIQKVIL